MGREVAVKVLKPGEGGYDLTLASRFVREARVLAELIDPHTIRLFDFGRDDSGLLYMVFELLSGMDLAELLSMRGTLQEGEVQHIMEQVLASLREAHRRGVLHRDIKPSNVCIYEYMGDPLCAKLIDFGIARHIDAEAVSLTKTGNVVGTIAYMAPEQARGEPLTPAADIYSLGAVAFEMLTGDFRAARGAPAAGPAALPCAEPLARLICAMLDGRPEARPHSADAALAALREPLPNDVPQSVPAPPVQAAPPRAGALVGLLSLIVGAILAVAWVATALDPTPSPAPSALTSAVSPPVSAAVAPLLSVPELAPALIAGDRVDVGADVGSGCGSKAATTGDGALVFRDGLDSHRAKRYVPEGHDSTVPAGLLVAFHTDFGSAGKMFGETRLRRFADRHGIVLLAPEGAVSTAAVAWSHRIDPFVIRGLIDELSEDVCIDPQRIDVLGHGSGGLAAEMLTCEPWVRAVITTSHRSNRGEVLCPEVAKPMLFFNPNGSKHLPAAGGSNCTNTRKLISMEEQRQALIARNRCTGEPTLRIQDGGRCESWTCAAPLEVCEIDGGHNWPGNDGRKFDVLRCDGQAPEYDYQREIWRFLERL